MSSHQAVGNPEQRFLANPYATHAVPAPYAIPSRKFGMWLFIISDAITFGALLIAYAFLRLGSPQWPHPFEFSTSILNATVMTVVLVTSSLTMVGAITAAKREDRGTTTLWLLATIGLGVTFAVLHLREWFGMFHEGVKLFHNPWGTPVFGAAFFGLTGLHILHVTGGVIYLLVVVALVRSRKITSNGVEIAGLYWCFVDLVWMFIYPMVYLLSAKAGA
jgi:cytochrome c oxidase subunit 3